MMKLLPFVVLFTLVSCASVKREHYEVRELPEKLFFFEDIQKYVSEAGDLKELKIEKTKKLNADVSSTFIRIDLKRSYILDVGLFAHESLTNIAQKKTKLRPAGKYLVITYKVPRGFNGNIFEDVTETYKAAKVTPEDLIFYIFQEEEKIQLFLRVK